MWLKPFKILKYSVIGLFIGTWALSTALSHNAPGKVDFRSDVQPIFKQFCIECHGEKQQMHGFRLDRRRDAMRGGTVIMITPGNSAGSRLYQKLIGNKYGPQMPLTGPLSPEQIDIIKAWIDQGAEWPDDLSGETASPPPDPKATLIMEALRDGDKKVFEKLASEQAKIGSLKGPGGATPLMQAALYGDIESVRLLLARGADPNIPNEAGATALMWAVDDIEKTRLLIEHGADVNARSADGRTPLLIATGQMGSGAVVKLLLDRGADIRAKSPAVIGYSTPLSEAARTGDAALLRLLIERGADVNSAGFQPLSNAYKAKCAECLELLMERADRATLTMAAVLLAPPLGDAGAVKMLVDKGAEANARDPKGNTLLMLTAGSDASPVDGVKALIERGADLNAKNTEGKTALDFAKLRGSNPVIDLLVKAGAKESVIPTNAAMTNAAPVNAAPVNAAPVNAAMTNSIPSFKPAASPRASLERIIPLLQKTDSIFIEKAGCVSCHHNTFTAMTVSIARKNGFAVDEQIARNQVKKIAAYLEIWRERVLQGVGIPGEPGSMSHMMVGLAAENYPPDAATDAFARFIASRQFADGRWRPFAHRPPIESSSDIPVTAVALRAIQVYGPKAQRAKYEKAVKLGAAWLLKAQPQTNQDRAFQILGLVWAGVKPDNEIIRQTARDLLREQRADGGWAQLPTLASDAYATGQALAALKQSIAVRVTDPAYKRGIEFLLKTQLEDGSWYVKSRAVALQPFFESGFPHGHDQWISAAASNWAAMALASTRAP